MILTRFMVEGFRFGSRIEDPMSSDAVTSIDLERSRNILQMEFDSRLRIVLSHMMSNFRISLFVTVDTMSCHASTHGSCRDVASLTFTISNVEGFLGPLDS